MTIRLLYPLDEYPANAVLNLDANTEAILVADDRATTDLTGGVRYASKAVSFELSNAIKLAGMAVDVAEFGVSPSRPSQFNRTTLQQLVDNAYAKNGGVYRITKPIPIDNQLIVWQRVWLEADWSGFVNQFVSGEMEPLGGWLVLDAGANVDALVFRCRLYNDGGILREVTHDRRNSEARHFGGARRLGVWGTRSFDQLPTATDLNSTGDAFSIQGARYVKLLDGCIGMMAAGDAIGMISFDYGTGALSSNNAELERPSGLSCAGYGGNLAGGDNEVENINFGYNGKSGLQNTGSGTITGGKIWNNLERGYISTVGTVRGITKVSGVISYDNNWNNFLLGGTAYGHSLVGCTARGGGRDTGATDADRANFQVGPNVQNWSLDGCVSQATDQDGNITARYDYYINNTTHAGSWDGATWDKDAPAPLGNFIANDDNLTTHGDNQGAAHPGVKLTGDVNANTHRITGVQELRFSGETTLTQANVVAGVLTLSVGGKYAWAATSPVTITTVNYTGTGKAEFDFRFASGSAVTYTHNLAGLRNGSGADIVLSATNHAIGYDSVTAAVWQHLRGKQA